MKKNKLYPQKENQLPSVQEPMAIYGSSLGYSSIDDRGVFSIIDSINKGISFASFENIIKKYNFTLQNWADFLHISNKTLSRYQKDHKTFDALQSERILQIEILYSKGEAVFGDRDYFTKWLETKNLALGDIVPLDLLKTSFGINLLLDELVRIEHGVLA